MSTMFIVWLLMVVPPTLFGAGYLLSQKEDRRSQAIIVFCLLSFVAGLGLFTWSAR